MLQRTNCPPAPWRAPVPFWTALLPQAGEPSPAPAQPAASRAGLRTSGEPSLLALVRAPAADDQEAQAVAPDDDLIAVPERLSFDSVAVDEHAVQAAVVKDSDAIGLAHDQGVAPRDRGIVEAHVCGEAATDAGPL